MKKLWIVANWKSNKSIGEAIDWLDAVGPRLVKNENMQIVVCPPFICIPELKKEIDQKNYPISLGSQDLSAFGKGAFTGAIPADLLQELVNFSIIGHSERREKFGETDAVAAEKVKQASDFGIDPIFCIQGLDTPIPAGVKIVAYEPVFAIGTGIPDTPENAQKVALEINSKSPEINVLYGGSVTSINCGSFVAQQNIKGLLIGKASLDPEEFLKIIDNCAKV